MGCQEYGVIALIFLGGGLAICLTWFFWIRVFMKWESWRNRQPQKGA